MLFGKSFESKIKDWAEALKVFHKGQSSVPKALTRSHFFSKEEVVMDPGAEDRHGIGVMPRTDIGHTIHQSTAGHIEKQLNAQRGNLNIIYRKENALKTVKSNLWFKTRLPPGVGQETHLAGRLKNFVHNWEKFTQDQWVLQAVQRVHIELTNTHSNKEQSLPNHLGQSPTEF